MEDIKFEWDNDKAKVNFIKHKGITFEEATSVFEDTNAIVFDDPDHSDDENRFIIIGMSTKCNLLIVCHCYREEVIRIISARKATSMETRQYLEINGRW